MQRKALLSALGEVDPSDTHLITFDLDKTDPRLLSSIAFKVPVTIENLIIHRCIIDEGHNTSVHSYLEKFRLPRAHSVSHDFTCIRRSSFPTTRTYRTHQSVFVDIEVVDAQLDYNILLDHSYMYAMKVVPSIIFHYGRTYT